MNPFIKYRSNPANLSGKRIQPEICNLLHKLSKVPSTLSEIVQELGLDYTTTSNLLGYLLHENLIETFDDSLTFDEWKLINSIESKNYASNKPLQQIDEKETSSPTIVKVHEDKSNFIISNEISPKQKNSNAPTKQISCEIT